MGRPISCSQGNSCARTSLYRNSSALSAWRCVDTEDLALGRQHGEERLDFSSPDLARMPQAVEVNEELGPVDVALLRPIAVMHVPQTFAQLRQSGVWI
jgi:hypothetical protein